MKTTEMLASSLSLALAVPFPAPATAAPVPSVGQGRSVGVDPYVAEFEAEMKDLTGRMESVGRAMKAVKIPPKSLSGSMAARAAVAAQQAKMEGLKAEARAAHDRMLEHLQKRPEGALALGRAPRPAQPSGREPGAEPKPRHGSAFFGSARAELAAQASPEAMRDALNPAGPLESRPRLKVLTPLPGPGGSAAAKIPEARPAATAAGGPMPADSRLASRDSDPMPTGKRVPAAPIAGASREAASPADPWRQVVAFSRGTPKGGRPSRPTLKPISSKFGYNNTSGGLGTPVALKTPGAGYGDAPAAAPAAPASSFGLGLAAAAPQSGGAGLGGSGLSSGAGGPAEPKQTPNPAIEALSSNKSDVAARAEQKMEQRRQEARADAREARQQAAQAEQANKQMMAQMAGQAAQLAGQALEKAGGGGGGGGDKGGGGGKGGGGDAGGGGRDFESSLKSAMEPFENATGMASDIAAAQEADIAKSLEVVAADKAAAKEKAEMEQQVAEAAGLPTIPNAPELAEESTDP